MQRNVTFAKALPVALRGGENVVPPASLLSQM